MLIDQAHGWAVFACYEADVFTILLKELVRVSFNYLVSESKVAAWSKHRMRNFQAFILDYVIGEVRSRAKFKQKKAISRDVAAELADSLEVYALITMSHQVKLRWSCMGRIQLICAADAPVARREKCKETFSDARTDVIITPKLLRLRGAWTKTRCYSKTRD